MSDHAATEAAPAPAAAQAHDTHAAHGHGLAHVMSVPMLLSIFGALLFLTFLTVAVSKIPRDLIDLGSLNIWIAMGIATVKGLLVATFFMHLRYDKLLNVIVFGMAFLFVFLFLGISMIDSHQYQGEIESWRHNQPGIRPEAGPSLTPPQGPNVEQPPAAATPAPATPAK